jgi:Integrase core domain
MLGIDISESTVGRYMIRTGRPRSQGWKTFLRNHPAGIASVDLFVVHTISFKLLYGLVILRHARRRLVRIAVTSNPTAEWIAGQVTEAFPWNESPGHLIRDRDGAFEPAYTRRIRAMGIRDHPVAARSPWQNGHVERLIGSVRRECLDHLVVAGEAHLRRTLKTYVAYYNEVRTHLTLDRDAPDGRRSERSAPSWRYRFWVGYIINMFGFSFLTSDRFHLASVLSIRRLLKMDGAGKRDRTGRRSMGRIYATRFVSVPIFSIVIDTMSSRLRKRGGLNPAPTPAGVPVAIMSADRSVSPFEITSINVATSKIMSPVLACCRSSSFTLQEMSSR